MKMEAGRKVQCCRAEKGYGDLQWWKKKKLCNVRDGGANKV